MRLPRPRRGNPRIQAVPAALLMHVFLPASFSNRQTGEAVAQLTQTDGYGTGQATYDLRRLCLRGLIERLPKSHRYRVTERGGTGSRSPTTAASTGAHADAGSGHR